MSVTVELNPYLLEEAEHATGVSEPRELVERALKQLIRAEAYRTSVAEDGPELDNDQLLRALDGPFMTVETYQPENSRVPCTEEERNRLIAESLATLESDDSLSPEQKAACLGLIELGGSEPNATAAPRRRFW